MQKEDMKYLLARDTAAAHLGMESLYARLRLRLLDCLCFIATVAFHFSLVTALFIVEPRCLTDNPLSAAVGRISSSDSHLSYLGAKTTTVLGFDVSRHGTKKKRDSGNRRNPG